VGRSRQPDQDQILLQDPEISRLHARLRVNDEGKVALENCSANGTFVNGRRVEQAVLETGDRIRFGANAANTFVYRMQSPTAKPPAFRAGDAFSDESAAGSVRPRETLHLGPEAMPAAHPRLQRVIDQYAVEDHNLETRLELGRLVGPNCVSIDHPSVSERHAEVVLTGDGKGLLRDIGSLHGTFVNGERVNECGLKEGDLIQLGRCETQFLLYREPHHHTLVLRDIELNRPVSTLGRDPRNSIQLEHPTVSLFHAEIARRDGGYELIDRNSTNGTYVNGERITRHALRARDRIALGAIQLVFDGNHIDQQSDGAGVRLLAFGLCRSVRDHRTGRPLALLDGISLVIEPREFVGLLGPAGSGKSTLMYALNGSYPADSGRVMINNSNLYQEFAALRAIMGYLPQEDILHRTLTIQECLYYAARLRLPDDFSEAEILTRVLEVIKILALSERADTQIGSLSGGQRKRVSLAIELLSKPSLLFMDEPTAGQDPRTEMKMMQHFREIANRGATVITTTHLLSSFSLLDKVGVLVRGKLAYFGPSQDMLSYFKTSRPTEVFTRLEERSSEDWAKRFRASEYFREIMGVEPVDAGTPTPVKRPAKSEAPAQERGHSIFRQLLTLIHRQLALRLRDWSSVAGLLIPPFAVAFLVGMMKQNPNEPKVLFMVIFSALWLGCSGAVREIVDEQAIYRRERERNLSILSYLGSKLVYVILLGIVQSGIFVSVLTLLDAQQNHFLEAWGIMTFMAVQGSLIGLVISALAGNPEKALYVFPLALIPQLLLAGLFVPVRTPQPFFPVVKDTGVIEMQELPADLITRGMSPTLRNVVSPLMVSRWGLEALADLYIHDWRPESLIILNTLAITLHPGDGKEARDYIRARNEWLLTGKGAAPEPRSGHALPSYVAILALFAVCMTGLIAVALMAKDRRGRT